MGAFKNAYSLLEIVGRETVVPVFAVFLSSLRSFWTTVLSLPSPVWPPTGKGRPWRKKNRQALGRSFAWSFSTVSRELQHALRATATAWTHIDWEVCLPRPDHELLLRLIVVNFVRTKFNRQWLVLEGRRPIWCCSLLWEIVGNWFFMMTLW